MIGEREQRRLDKALRLLVCAYELVYVVDLVDVGEPVVALRARRHERGRGGIAAADDRTRRGAHGRGARLHAEQSTANYATTAAAT